MAPLYDSLTTRVFPGLKEDRMALELAGKDDRLDFRDFETLARTIELPLTRVKEIASELITALEMALDKVKLTRLVVENPDAASMAAAVMEISRARLAAMKASL